MLEDIRHLNSIDDEGKAIAEVYLLIDVSNHFGAGENLFEESIQFLINLLKQVSEHQVVISKERNISVRNDD